jgi:hypothetical protein
MAPEIAWPALLTALAHGALAWLEPRRERALVHAAYAMAGTMLTAAALGANGQAVAVGSVNAVLGWLVLALTPSISAERAGHRSRQALHRVLPYVPLTLVTVTWLGLPFTTGWLSRGVLMQIMWDTHGPQMLALAVVISGAALSVLYRAWHTLLQRSATGVSPSLERGVGAAVAATPFLVPVLGFWFVSLATSGSGNVSALDVYGIGAWIGLGGVLLWVIFLGYGRDWLALLDHAAYERILQFLRLGWLLQSAERLAHVASRVLLRLRAIGEGEHYLAWALLTAVCIGLLLLFSPLAQGS